MQTATGGTKVDFAVAVDEEKVDLKYSAENWRRL